jgi:transcriptional regulator with GAF, ATPase, and Fis domain
MSDQQLAQAFVEMADTLVDDFDLMEFLHLLADRCVSLLNVSAAGLLLADQRGALRLVAASTEQTRLLELFQLETYEGPCVECFDTGRPVAVADLAAADRWPRFVAQASEAGFASVHALPMRLRTEIIGTLNLFSTRPGTLPENTIRLGQALADVATIGLLQARSIRQRETLAEQLQAALTSRIIIEQAKGVLAERHNIDMSAAFTMLRAGARDHNRGLSDLASAIIAGTASL